MLPPRRYGVNAKLWQGVLHAKLRAVVAPSRTREWHAALEALIARRCVDLPIDNDRLQYAVGQQFDLRADFL